MSYFLLLAPKKITFSFFVAAGSAGNRAAFWTSAAVIRPSGPVPSGPVPKMVDRVLARGEVTTRSPAEATLGRAFAVMTGKANVETGTGAVPLPLLPARH